MSNIIPRQQAAAWPFGVWLVVLAFALIVWLNGLTGGASLYRVFPIFGLVAFSTMWVQYVTLCVQQATKQPGVRLAYFYKASGFVVLVAILMHPGLLIYQLWRDGFGLPPGSVLAHYVAPMLGWVVVLGMVSLLIFLAYELQRVFGSKSWWKLEVWATELAMVAVFYHALTLGTETHISWFRAVWIFYGVTLVLMLAYLHWRSFTAKDTKQPEPWRIAGVVAGAVAVIAGVVAISVGLR